MLVANSAFLWPSGCFLGGVLQDAGVPEVEAAGVEPADDLIAAHALERMYRPIFVPLEGQAEPPPRMRDMIERQYVLHKSLKMS